MEPNIVHDNSTDAIRFTVGLSLWPPSGFSSRHGYTAYT